MIRDPRLTQISVGKVISLDLDVMGLVKAYLRNYASCAESKPLWHVDLQRERIRGWT